MGGLFRPIFDLMAEIGHNFLRQFIFDHNFFEPTVIQSVSPEGESYNPRTFFFNLGQIHDFQYILKCCWLGLCNTLFQVATPQDDS